MPEFDVLDGKVIEVIKKYARNGVDPSILIRALTATGASRRDAQLAVQRALDEGTADLGARMRVYPGTKVQGTVDLGAEMRAYSGKRAAA